MGDTERRIEDYVGALSVLAHDVRNPVSVILLAAGAIERGVGDVRTVARARRIVHAAKCIDRLAQDYLLTGVIESGRFRVSVEPIDLGEVLVAAAELLVETAEQAEARIVIEGRCGEKILGDRARLKQAFTNVLDNAIKHTPRGGTVSVSTERPGAAIVRVSIADEGPGVPTETRQTIFERFWKGEDGERCGSGLGLYIARSIVESHGGAIWVECPERGGSVFRIDLRVGIARVGA